jgi:hypothetical protein
MRALGDELGAALGPSTASTRGGTCGALGPELGQKRCPLGWRWAALPVRHQEKRSVQHWVRTSGPAGEELERKARTSPALGEALGPGLESRWSGTG